MAKKETWPVGLNDVVLTSAVNPRRIEVLQMPGDEPSATRQEFVPECDINTIMARYQKTGLVPMNAASEPQYLDLTMTPANLMEAMNLMIEAEASFMLLPAHVRKDFDNDPMRFVEFASSPDNLERMREWGLAAPAPVEEPPMRVEVVSPPTAPAGDPAKT